MGDAKLTLSEALALSRRYMQAVADGRISESEINSMSDDDLIAFDDELAELLDEAQEEAETAIKDSQS